MGITRSLRRLTWRAFPVAGLAALLTAGAAISQEGGGVLLTFGIDQRFSWEDNPELEIPSTGDRFRSDTRLSFGGVSETSRDRLSFNLAGTLRGEDAGDGFDFGLDSPSAELAYTRLGYSSSFTISGFLRETDLDEGRALIEGEDGSLPVLIFEDGTARSKGAQLDYTWGEGMPLGGSLRTGLTDTTYSDTTDPDLMDNRTITAGAGLRFALNEVTDATLDLDHRRYDEDDDPAGAEDSTTLSAGLVRSLPRGNLRGELSTTQDEDGTRNGLSFGRTFELPRGSLSFDLGLTDVAGSGTYPTGALDWRQELARGAFSAQFSSAVIDDTDNEETLVTALSLALTQELTTRVGLNLGASWVRREELDTSLVTDNASINASLSYALTEDWAMNFGATHKVEDEDDFGRADSSSVFLSVGRTFDWRP
jgi:hypothetical protein